MIVTVASYKGGAGKSTTAVHLAAYFQTLAPTLLLDGDKTRSALNWGERGAGFPFQAAPISQAVKQVPKYAKEGHIVIDTGQRLEEADLREAVDSCDLLVIPATPSPLDTDGLMQTIEALARIGASHRFRVLLTKTPPAPQRDAIVLRRLLEDAGVSIFKTDIPLFKAFAKAAGAGEIVSQTKDDNATRAWNAYVAAGREIL